jgi:cytochrome c oxidase subunit 2
MGGPVGFRSWRSIGTPVAILVGGCLGLTLITLQAQQRAEAPAPRVVHVTAERFDFTPAEVTVVEGTAIEFRLSSEDTAHGFRIIGQQVEVVIPKRGRGETTVRFVPPAPGSYVFECSRMCGAGHSFMRGSIKVTSAEASP